MKYLNAFGRANPVVGALYTDNLQPFPVLCKVSRIHWAKISSNLWLEPGAGLIKAIDEQT
jgi:hypothetical protein